MIAVHITNKAGYDAIVKAREIRPRGRKRRHGESGWGFETDYLAGDARYVFLRLSEKYQLMTSTEYSKSGPSLRRNYPCAVRVKANKRGEIHVRSNADSY